MKKPAFITILTPTYNRASYLISLYQSLLNQSDKDFIWLVVDDGSQDNTKLVIEDLANKDERIQYLYKINGGKHRAVNYSKEYINTELVFIVDSDDILDSIAIETIRSDWSNSKYEIVGISYLRRDPSGKTIGDLFTKDYFVSTHLEERIIRRIRGDKAEVWKSSLFFSIPFLEFDDESFFSEQHKYLSISGVGRVLFINKSIYICEYLEGGLSSKIKKLQYHNPNGALENTLILSNKDYPFWIRLKSYIQIYNFSKLSKRRFYDLVTQKNYGSLWVLLIPIAFMYHNIFVCSIERKP